MLVLSFLGRIRVRLGEAVKKRMEAFYYSSPPPPPPTTVTSPPQSQPSGYYNPSQTSTPPSTSNAHPPTSPSPQPPPSTSPPPASQPSSAPLDAYSPPPPPLRDNSLPPDSSAPPPPLSSPPSPTPALYPPLRSAAPPTISPLPSMRPLSPPPAAIPPMSPIYYKSPPPPPPSHILPPPCLPPPPPALPPPPSSYSAPASPLAPPPKALSPSPPPSISNSTPPLSSPMPRRSPTSLPLAVPFKPKTPSSSNSTKDTGSILRSSSSLKSVTNTVGTVAAVAVVAGLLMLTFVGAAVWLVKKRKKPVEPINCGGNLVMASSVSSHASELSHARSSSNPLVRHGSGRSYGFPDIGLGHTKLWFTLEELSTITNDFSTQNLLGEGGCSCVYKGHLQDGREVAVKQIKVGGAQGEREFKAEVETISRVHHRHLVSLVGYCVSENKRLLVYGYVPNKTLYYHLHGKGRPIMEWTVRVKIAVGAARGIAYLHEDCHPRIIHRDIKSSNILLDHNFEAQVSDFGLARSAMDANTYVTTQVMGTFGYLAPEYATSGKLTDKSDVYSFGVVLLELITGRKPVDTSQPLGDESLVEWARPLLLQALENGHFGYMPDPRLDGNYNKDEMFCMIEIAAACIRHSSTMRPRMGQVVRALDSLSDLDITNGVRPGHSEIFNSSPQSEEIRIFQRMGLASQEYSSDYSRAG